MSGETDNLPPVIRCMLSPDFYPRPTAGPVTLVQTNLAYVLLTGGVAYKAKRLVRLGFADFGTLDRRRHFFQVEVRLNQRGAPGVYLGVETICRQGDDVHLGGPGEPVEYAVKMRQLPADLMFDSLLRHGQLGPDLIDALARAVADYHAAAPTNPQVAQFGTPDRVRRAIDDVDGRAARFVGGPQTREQAELTRRFTDDFINRHGSLLLDRVADGFVRECHGDLHLANICLCDGRVVLFDCIEFDESLRCADLVQDAAFPAMDLEAGGRRDLSARFVNTYAERTGDWAGLRLLRFYQCRHASVRAMVNSLRLDDAGISPDVAEQARRTAVAYYTLASTYAVPRAGRLVLVMGLSGSGKSTVARGLAERVGAIHIRSDAVRKHRAGVPLDAAGGASLYAQDITARTYDRLLQLGLLLAGGGETVLLDATYGRREQRAAAIAAARAVGLPVSIVQCVAPPDVCRARVAARQGDVSDARPDMLERQAAGFEAIVDVERPFVTAVDTADPVDVSSLARQVLGATPY